MRGILSFDMVYKHLIYIKIVSFVFNSTPLIFTLATKSFYLLNNVTWVPVRVINTSHLKEQGEKYKKEWGRIEYRKLGRKIGTWKNINKVVEMNLEHNLPMHTL